MARLSPAAYVIQIFGGVRATGRALGRTHGSVALWTKEREHRGRAGGVPRALHVGILELAKVRGLDITPNDLIRGRQFMELNVGDRVRVYWAEGKTNKGETRVLHGTQVEVHFDGEPENETHIFSRQQCRKLKPRQSTPKEATEAA